MTTLTLSTPGVNDGARANRPALSPRPSLGDILSQAQAGLPVVQDFRPLAESIEWDLGQLYLKERGSKAFINDPEPVPYVVNNDGTLSADAAEVLFANLLEVDQAGALEPDVFVLELGIGVGLFARFFLDAFRELCEAHGKDYYDRLTYVAADRSQQMLVDACRHGIFSGHPGRYLLRLADALCPERTLLQDPALEGAGPRPFRAVFLNYLLDCLPAAVLRFDEGGARQLCVRTCVARGVDLREFTDMGVEELARLAASPDRRELLGVYGLLVSQYAYEPVDLKQVPYGEFAAEVARCSGGAGSLLHNYGALQCLDRLLDLVREGGFVLANDYGPAESPSAEHFEHQRFSHATFVGVNFPLLRAYYSCGERGQWVEPPEGDASVHARLLGRQVGSETVGRFTERFSEEARERLQGPVRRAREYGQHGRLEAALAAYGEALEGQPRNWALMNEVAHFLTFGMRDPAAGLELAKEALALNPTCSAELWNMAGDALYALGRLKESEQAFLRALAINPDDVRARYNLAYVHASTGQHAVALRRIAEALALDGSEAYREDLLRKQAEVLAQLERRQQQHYRVLANRVSDLPGPRGGERIADKPVRKAGSAEMSASPPRP